MSHLVVPISLGILVALFAIQRQGTGAVGWLFGPVILVWFAVIGILGGKEVLAHPGVVQGLSPVWGAYHIYVQPTKTDITHTQALYLIDRRGFERSGYLWPYLPNFVALDLRTLAGEST